MKKLLSLILIFLCSHAAVASDFQVTLYPDTNKVDVITTSVDDTVTMIISNLGVQEISEFFLTVVTDDSVIFIENKIDGNIVSDLLIEVIDGIVYPGQLSTRLLLGNFTQTVTLKFYTLQSDNSHITFCGRQPFAFFGIAEPLVLNCCIGIRGNIDGDAQDNLDISDLVYLVNYSFGIPGGPAPICFEEADVNASGSLDISDIVAIVNFMFSLGENIPPADCP